MTKIIGITTRDVASRHEQVTGAATSAVHQTLKTVANGLSGVVTIDDLGILLSVWSTHVDATLMPQVSTAYQFAVKKTKSAIAAEVRASLAAGPTSDDSFIVPTVRNHVAEQRMENARNRLVNVGNEVWESARSQLLTGLQAGEGIADLKSRVLDSTGFGEARAQVIARSEIGSAMNGGSIDQMQALNLTGASKEWIAIDDSRTRSEHLEIDGEKVALDGTFSIGFDPGDDYNCRCTTGFDIADDDCAGNSLTADAGDGPICSIDDLASQLSDSLPSTALDDGATGADLVNLTDIVPQINSSLTDDQFKMLNPVNKRTESAITKALESTSEGKNVLSSIKTFTEKRGGVSNLRKAVARIADGDDTVSTALRSRVDDFVGAMNNFPTGDVPKLYRGLAIKVEENTNAWWDAFEAQYEPGKILDLNVSSFTSSERKAAEFQGMIGGTKRASGGYLQMRVVVDGPVHALPVEQLSKFKSEKEWISGGKFKVTSLTPATKATPYYVVHVQQLSTL